MHMINYVRQLHGLWWLLIEQFPALYPVRRFDPGRFSHKWTRTVMERSTAESLYLGSEWTMMDHDIQTGLAAGLTGYSFRCLQITSKLTWICTTYPSLCRLRLWSIYLSISYHAKFAPTHAIQKTLKTTIYIYRYMNIHVYRSLPKLVGFNPTVHYCSIHVQYLFPCHWLTKVSYILEGKRCLDNISAGGTRVDFITSLYRCVMCCSVLVASILSEENSLNAPKLTLSYTNQCLSNYSLLIRSLKWV